MAEKASGNPQFMHAMGAILSLIRQLPRSPPHPQIDNYTVCSQGKSIDLGVREPRVQILSLTCCVILGKSLNLSELQCVLLQYGDDEVQMAGAAVRTDGGGREHVTTGSYSVLGTMLETGRRSCKAGVTMFCILQEEMEGQEG